MDRLEDTADTDTVARVLQDCSYRNSSDRMVILRCCGSHQFFLERVVFPFEILAFSCPPMSEIKIWSHGLYGPELLESFLSDQLLVEPFTDGPRLDATGMFPTPSATLRTAPWLQAG
ncbi:MAG: DUF1830 domain-containing protein [Cyanobacteriota bacterium]|nr:DUF1830 domain-containing protein [Cyanobacteriota bacterium]